MRVVGERDGTPALLRAGQAVDANTIIETGAEGLLLDLRDGARVEITPGSRVRLGDEAPAQVIIGSGQVRGELPPAGGSPRPPLRLATPSATAEIGGSGQVWVSVRDDGRAWFACVAGMAAIFDGGQDERGSQVDATLGPGRSVVAAESLGEVMEGPTTVAAAREAGTTLRSQGVEPSDEFLPAAMAELEIAIASAEAEQVRGHRLAQEHREAIAAKAANARELQRALVQHAQGLQRSRDVLTTYFERARATALLLRAAPDPTTRHRQRVRALLDRVEVEVIR